tara:strand:- start:579 stop:803 length:225 start_codon:yes stop_codon:yes gene_type:complete
MKPENVLIATGVIGLALIVLFACYLFSLDSSPAAKARKQSQIDQCAKKGMVVYKPYRSGAYCIYDNQIIKDFKG